MRERNEVSAYATGLHLEITICDLKIPLPRQGVRRPGFNGMLCAECQNEYGTLPRREVQDIAASVRHGSAVLLILAQAAQVLANTRHRTGRSMKRLYGLRLRYACPCIEPYVDDLIWKESSTVGMATNRGISLQS